jgi:release factor glutamine methyltransferase
VPKPRESAVHLLLHALGLDWDDGHHRLREVVASLPPPLTRAGRNAPAVGLAGRTLLLEECLLYMSLLKRRTRFKPMQYIVGRGDFHHLSGLRIRRPMLCPRPETEELVELVLSDVGRLIADPNIGGAGGGWGGRRVRVLDVGSLGPPERQGHVGH